MRIPFLALTPVCVFLGFASAVHASSEVSTSDLLLVTLGALCAHVSVNTFNEFLDFRSGLDAKTQKTPFSGGSGALIDEPNAATAVLLVALMSLGLTVLVGLYFSARLGATVLVPGIVGIVVILSYTSWLNRSPFLCLIAPGLGFGLLMTFSTHLVLSGDLSVESFWIALVPFFLVNNLLLLNQFPDIDADRSVGRRHFPIVYGKHASIFVYAAFSIAASLVIVSGVFLNILPSLALVALIPVALTIVVLKGLSKQASSTEQLLPFMGMNVAATLLTPVVLGSAILLAT